MCLCLCLRLCMVIALDKRVSSEPFSGYLSLKGDMHVFSSSAGVVC